MTQLSQDLKEQLAPVAAKLRECLSVVRPVSQVTLRLRPAKGHDRFTESIKHVLKWMNRRAGRSLPDAAWRGQSFELNDIGAQRTAAVALPEHEFWSARLDDADKTVPLRSWVTEIGVGMDANGDTLFGARLICVSRGTDEPFQRTVPGFVRAIMSDGPVEVDGTPLTRDVPLISTVAEVDQLVALLERPHRQTDVLVFALPDGSSNPSEAAASANMVHEATLGAAHVYVVTGPASFLLTDRVGRELSVFRQAVRTYRPGFRAWVDEPSRHPLALPDRIASCSQTTTGEFERWLVNQSLGNSAHAPGREERLPSFNKVRQLAGQIERERLRKAGGTDAELIRLFEQDNEQLRNDLQEQKDQYDGLLVAADAEREAAIQEASAAKAQALERLHRIRQLEKRFTESTAPQITPIPDSLDEFESWCKENVVGSVEIANRAYQGVRKSEFHDPQFIYRALLLLRDHYVPMRIQATPERRTAYEEALRALQLEDSATGEAVKYSPDLYSVQYGGMRRPLDRHLKGSDSRDRRYCFRLYFFWDDESQVVVVGWLPSHLDNRAS
ncbi:hypothetical protein [Caballeronia sp. LZ035]|uniref:hypothetical protein n=1 Tax=Caballeronia sp. LZ035 TaxID=3038568 RepID=UPI002863E767|nr:hypothetical protein [Caballeronia sp. LZ035]MDR5758610.1 hypothetical protein [Caballeronia sp. LZ035]